MNAQEEVALFATELPAITQCNQRVPGSRHHHTNPATLELGAEELGDRERDVLLVQDPRKMESRVARVFPAVTGIDHDRMWVTQHAAWRQAGRSAHRRPPRNTGGARG